MSGRTSLRCETETLRPEKRRLVFCCSVCSQGFLAKVEKVGLAPRHKLVGVGYSKQSFKLLANKALASFGESELQGVK